MAKHLRGIRTPVRTNPRRPWKNALRMELIDTTNEPGGGLEYRLVPREVPVEHGISRLILRVFRMAGIQKELRVQTRRPADHARILGSSAWTVAQQYAEDVGLPIETRTVDRSSNQMRICFNPGEPIPAADINDKEHLLPRKAFVEAVANLAFDYALRTPAATRPQVSS